MSGVVWLGIATVMATFFGPISAVMLTRWVDHRRDIYARRLNIFRTMMSARNFPLSREFVGALNLIDVEFHECTKVIAAWRALLTNLSGPLATTNEEALRVTNQRRDLRTDVLVEIAKVVRLPVPDLDIFRGVYSPRGWATAETEQEQVRQLFAGIARGEKGLPIEVRTSAPPRNEA